MSNESRTGESGSTTSAGEKTARLHATAAELMGCRTEEEVHELTVAAAERVLAFDRCGLDVVEDGRLVARARSAERARAEPTPLSADAVAAEAVRSGESIVVDDVRDSDLAPPAGEGYRSTLAVPLSVPPGGDAVFRAGARSPAAFDPADRRLAELLVSHAESALGRVRSEAVLRERNRTIARLHETAAELVALDAPEEVHEAVVAAAEDVLSFGTCAVLSAPAGDEDPPVDPGDDATAGRGDERPDGSRYLAVVAATDDPAAPDVGTTVGPGDGLAWDAFAAADSRTDRTAGGQDVDERRNADDRSADDRRADDRRTDDPRADDRGAGAPATDDRDAADDRRANDDRGDPVPAGGGEHRSALAVPMGEVGVLLALADEPDAFDDADRELAELLASQAGAVLARLRAERRRADERDRLAALFEHVPDPAVRVRFDEDGRPIVRAVNPAFEETFGYSAEEALGRDVDELVVPECEREDAAAVNEAVRRGESFHRETRRATADGELRAFLAHLVPIERSPDNAGAFAIYTDVTERERREQRLGALQEATRDLMAADDAEDASELAVRAARDILGLSVSGVYLLEDDRLEPVAWTDVAGELYGDDPPAFGPGDESVWGAFEAGGPRVVHPAGGEHVDAALVVPLGEHGVFISAAPSATAYTDQVVRLAGVLAATVETALDRAERERVLRERERELERQNERLEQFASVISHDLRGPLSVARGNLDLARETGDDEYLERVESAHRRIDAMVDDVLTLARQGEVVGATEPVDVARVARRAWAGVEGPAAELTVREPGRVDADPDRLLQLLENLLGNAVEHGDGTVTVEVGALDDRAGFYVADDGPGIPPGERSNVLEYGYTTADDGTGLGLAIVAEIAEAHGWELSLSDAEAGGARFEVHTG